MTLNAPPRKSRRFAFAVALLVVITVVAFAPAYRGPQVYDDPQYTIQNNPTITQLWPPSVAPLSPPKDRTVSGRPIANYSFALNYAINNWLGVDQRPDPFGAGKTISYHLLTLILHVLTRPAHSRRRPVEPLLPGHSATNGDSGRTASLSWWLRSGCCILSRPPPSTTCRNELKYWSHSFSSRRSTQQAASARGMLRSRLSSRLGWYAASVATCLLGMGSKEVMVGAPLLVMLYDRAFRSNSWREWRTTVIRRRGWFYVALFATLARCWSTSMSADHEVSPAGFGGGMTWYDYLNIQGWAIPHYLPAVRLARRTQLRLWPPAGSWLGWAPRASSCSPALRRSLSGVGYVRISGGGSLAGILWRLLFCPARPVIQYRADPH